MHEVLFRTELNQTKENRKHLYKDECKGGQFEDKLTNYMMCQITVSLKIKDER